MLVRSCLGGFSWFGEPGNGNDDPMEKIRLALSGVDGDLSPAKSERTADMFF